MSPDHITREKNHGARRTATHSARSTVAIIGLNEDGVTLATRAAASGYAVMAFEADEVRAAQLESRDADFLDEESARIFKTTTEITVTSREADLKGIDTYIICTPARQRTDQTPDLHLLEESAKHVGRTVSAGALVVIESVVNPGVCEEILLPHIEKESGLSRWEFHFAHCPARTNLGDKEWPMHRIPRVIGALTDEGLHHATSLYETLIDADLYASRNIKETEAVKMLENSFRDVNIALVNELSVAFETAGIDIMRVIEGAATKPFGFLPHYPGTGVGGHIAVDPHFLIRHGHRHGFEHRLLKAARQINNSMPHHTVRILTETLREKKKSLKGAQVALLGLAYKGDIADTLGSPALVIKETLEKRGAIVRVYDPHVAGSSLMTTIDDAIKGADAAVIATDHTLFKGLTPDIFIQNKVNVVIDGPNCLDKDAYAEAGIAYRGTGRS